MAKKIGVKIWSMSSDAGYTPSGGSCRVYLVPAKAAASAAGERAALLELLDEDARVQEDDLQDVQQYSARKGVCNYRGVTGVLQVPPGMVVLERVAEHFSTGGGRNTVRILGEDSLGELYLQRAEMFARLAEEAAAS